MKLHEIRSFKGPKTRKATIEVEPAGGIYDTFDVEVEYEVTPASSSVHVPGDPSTREHHPGSLDIISVTTTSPITASGNTYPKGTDATTLPGWDKSDDKYIENHVIDLEADED